MFVEFIARREKQCANLSCAWHHLTVQRCTKFVKRSGISNFSKNLSSRFHASAGIERGQVFKVKEGLLLRWGG